jgi:Flp pilus assembly protein TadG
MILRRLCNDQDGATMVEYSIVVPLLVAVTFGLLEVGLLLWAQVGLQHGVETAARCASTSDLAIKFGSLNAASNPTPCYSSNGTATANADTVKAYAATNSFGLNPPASTFTVSYNAAACPAGNLVSASYPFTAITYLFSTTLTAKSCYPTSI